MISSGTLAGPERPIHIRAKPVTSIGEVSMLNVRFGSLADLTITGEPDAPFRHSPRLSIPDISVPFSGGDFFFVWIAGDMASMKLTANSSPYQATFGTAQSRKRGHLGYVFK
jgi:hypothetical protein